MKNIKPFNTYFEPIQESLSEAVQTKAIDVDNEQENQSKLSDLIKIAKNKMAKVDAIPNKKQFEKTAEKGKLTQTIAKLTANIANSMNKEAQALLALSKEQSKQ